MTNNGLGAPRPVLSIDNVEHRAPVNNDLEDVRRLTTHLDFLREQVRQCEDALHEAWLKIPYDPEITRRPWKSDIKVNCRNCGRPTLWRSSKGHAMHINKDGLVECPPDKLGRSTPGIAQEIWDILDMDDEDGETLEIITKEDRKPSEREG